MSSCTKCGCLAIELRDVPPSRTQLCDRCYPQTRVVGTPTGCGCLDRRHEPPSQRAIRIPSSLLRFTLVDDE